MTRHLTLETFATPEAAIARRNQLKRHVRLPQIWPYAYPGGWLIISFGIETTPAWWHRLWFRFRYWCAR